MTCFSLVINSRSRGTGSGPDSDAQGQMMSERPSWNQYFMTITRQVAERSTCLRAKVGAVIVRDRSILATGYNGSPAGLPHCTEAGCLIYESRTPDGELEQNCYRTIHAEINAITQAARNGSAIRDADIYVTHTPCIHCLKVLINTGIRNVFYEKEYKIHTVADLLSHARIKLAQVAAEVG
jgi:dCMP deaminase